MLTQPKTIIAIEEHYWDAELATHFKGTEAARAGDIEHRLYEFGGARIADMDAAEIDRLRAVPRGPLRAEASGGDRGRAYPPGE